MSQGIKIFNDPVYGFVNLKKDLSFRIVEHPYFQRLRRIKQLGMTHYVYPGALHTRFHHALGAVHLLSLALENLVRKNVDISPEEQDAVSLAVLLHDIGHGPFSHALENAIVPGLSHEDLSLRFMEYFNVEFGGLDMAISIFKDTYPKKFLHSLVSGQLDVDRLDYLRRDSFYTGVVEGNIGSDRIINMMNVRDDELVIEAKGIYSIEKFLLARRLMYWQVYLHKTVVAAEQLLLKIFIRAKEIAALDASLFCTPAFSFFLRGEGLTPDSGGNSKVLDTFAQLDDFDIMASIKVWAGHSDFILSTLCKKMIDRHLYKCTFSNEPVAEEELNALRSAMLSAYPQLDEKGLDYFVFTDKVENSIYSADKVRINILTEDGTAKDIAEVSGQYDLHTLSRQSTKYFLCYPKELRIKN